MASAYKAAMRSDDSDSDMEDVSDQSNTVEGDSSEEETRPKKSTDQTAELRNRILMLTSRGVSHRHRHLLNDLQSLLPHTYKDTKLDTKSSNNYNAALNGLADLHSCNYIFFLEARKHGQDLYLWLCRPPNGPTIKFHVNNIHTMGELGFGGNCLKGGRGIVVFDKSFEDSLDGNEYKSLIREMLRGVFCVPSKGIRGMKPFIDRVIGIYGLDGKIWVRVYEIREGDKETATEISLVEVGPRFVLTPVLIQEGSFGGPIIYENRQFVSPNQVRSEIRLQKAGKYAKRMDGREERVVKKKSLGLEFGKRKPTSLDNTVLFG